MFYFTAIIFFPALLVLFLPAGLSLMGLVGGKDVDTETGTALAPIVGLAALSVVVSVLLHFKLPASSLLPVAVGINVAAIVQLRLAGRHDMRIDWRILAALLALCWLAYLILISPLLIDGRFGVMGYKVNNDPVFHSIMPEYLDTYGYNFATSAKGGFADAASDKFVVQGYPDSWHQILLLAMHLFARRAWMLFDLVEAFFAALMVPVAYVWLRKGNISKGWGLFGGLIASVGYIQMSYLFQGFAPQVAVVPFIYACLYLFYETIREGRRRLSVLAALLLQAGLSIYSFTILIWLAVFIVAILVHGYRSTRNLKRLAIDIGTVAFIGLIAVAMNPFTLLPMSAAYRMVADWSAANSMGNLISAQVPILPVFGMWPAGDHRGVPIGLLHWAAYTGALFVGILIYIGLKSRQSRPWLYLLAITVVVPAVILKVGASPYYFAKTLHVAGPVAGIAATAGLYRISTMGQRRWSAVLASVFAAVIALGYIFGLTVSNYTAIRFTSITPAEQFAELEDINRRFEGSKGPVLLLDTGEDWGKYLLANLNTGAPFATSYLGTIPVIRPVLAQAGINDMDSLKGIVSRKYPLVIIAKHQDISLPPPPYLSVYEGRLYNVYRAGPWPDTRDIISHRPFETAPGVIGAYRELQPGDTISMPFKRGFSSLLLSAYLWPEITDPERSVVFTAGGRSISVPLGFLPSVYDLPLKGDSGTVLRVKNSTPHPLRLDWVEGMRVSNDRAALFRYNGRNRHVFESMERISR